MKRHHYKQYINLSEKEHKASKYLAYHNLGKAELVAGNVNEAIYYLRQIRSYNKKMSAEIESELGLCFYIQKKYAEAKEAFSNSIMLESVLPAGYFGLGLIYLDQKSYTKAIESLKKANEIKPDDSSITRALNYANIMQLELEGDLPPAN